MAATPKQDHPKFATDAIRSDVKNGVFLGNPVLDNVVTCLVAMGTELWATKRRLKVVEAVMAKHGVTTEMVERYEPSEQEKVAWEADRDHFIELTLGPLADEGTRNISSDFPKRG